MFGGLVLFLYLGSLIVLFGFFMSLTRLLNCLIVVENFNVLLILFCLLSQWDEFRMFFIALIVIFTVEVTLGLVVLTRLWDSSSLIGIVGV
uniref:NADH dehydrogenase subunit 4L n=1 Tax=Echinostoma miyagawai TaxID=1579201 RepID=A0A386HU34_9TREM|nr:NADH dehydrogenase subunit 4L [Echinostoma miyagawai]AYD49498.1 NADH dehydrogenase subunit 4L [Echinostoma miyagawai]QEG55043.1 NADH dehydrogenase subunit 4L [Echinostoma miyagawai]WCK11538.1 NADH dehydrogenase subunit 4L [Echinostoma miyagawai]